MLFIGRCKDSLSKPLNLRQYTIPDVGVGIRLVYRLSRPEPVRGDMEMNVLEKLASPWKITVGSIFPSVIVFSLAAERSVSTSITIYGDDFQVSFWCESSQDNGPFKSRNFRFPQIALSNISLSQNVDRGSRFMNTFSVLQNVFKVTEGKVPLCHSENGMLRKLGCRNHFFPFPGIYVSGDGCFERIKIDRLES